jgi:hypothetical protein
VAASGHAFSDPKHRFVSQVADGAGAVFEVFALTVLPVI